MAEKRVTIPIPGVSDADISVAELFLPIDEFLDMTSTRIRRELGRDGFAHLHRVDELRQRHQKNGRRRKQH